MARILVVDDNPANSKLARVVLERAGHVVRTAGCSDEALALIPEFLPALILMDVQLPGMDGLELTRLLKSDPASAAITIVALTAYAMVGDEARALAAGCEGYIPKPIDTRTIAQTLAGFLARRAEDAP